MSQQEVNLDPRQLMAALIENFNQYFFAESRENSKRMYNGLREGKAMQFMHVKLQDDSELHCHLVLDTTLYVGKLNYGRFRKALAMLLLGAKKRLEREQDLNIMNSASGDIMFNIPGIVQADDGTNVMVCGLSQMAPGQVKIRLMYLDPEQYADAAVAGRAEAEQDPGEQPA